MRGLQLTSALLLELAVFAAFAYWGWTVHWALGVAAFAVVTVAWGLFLSPKAKFPLPVPAKIVAKAFVFAGAVLALVATGATVLGLVFGALLAVLLVSEAVWPWAHLARTLDDEVQGEADLPREHRKRPSAPGPGPVM